MAKTMTSIFRGLNPGDVCTGTISYFGLRSSGLAAKGMIALKGTDWIFLSATPQEIEPEEMEYDDE